MSAPGPERMRPDPRAPRSLAVNASANAIRIVLGAATAVVSTAVVTRALDPDEYGAWGLVLQLSTYFFLFDIGLTLAVSREVAVSSSVAAPPDALSPRTIVSTAAAALAVLAVAGAVVVAAVAVAFDGLFGSIPDTIVPDARWAFVVVAGSLVVGLPFATVTGYFNGVRRSHVPAVFALGARLATTVGVIVVVARGGGVVGIATVSAACGLAGGLGLALAGHRDHPGLLARRAATWAAWRRLRAFSAHAFVYALATFAIVNLDAVLVARLDYGRLGAYVIAVTVVGTLAATHAAAVGALLPVVADLAESRRDEEVIAVAGRTAGYSTMFVVATIAPLLVGAPLLLRWWVGADYAASATGPLRLLLLASAARFTCAVLSQAYFGMADRWPVTGAVIAEGVVNFGASLALGHRYGAPGVALGTLIGAGAGVAVYLVLAPRRALGSRLPIEVGRGAIRPALAVVPLAVTAPWWYGWQRLGEVGTSVIAIGSVLVALAWLVTCLSDSDRRRLRSLVARRPPTG